MRPELKFCGLTRPEDAALAAELGARYVGAIFAGGPRALDGARAATVLAAAGDGVRRVGVFDSASDPLLEDIVTTAALGVVQLHGDPSPSDVEAARARTGCAIWAVVRVRGAALPPAAADLFAVADAVLLDARVDGILGGTGVPLPWGALAGAVGAMRGRARLVVAGGLTADNVAAAIRTLSPDIVDVSSGVEQAPGVKDAARMRAFAKAVAA